MLFPRLVLLTVIFSLWINLPNTVKADEAADWGDVVNVNYSLYLDAEHTDPVQNNIDVIFEYIYLSRNTYVPTRVSNLYPEASAGLLEKFKEGIVGLEVNKRKDVNIKADDGYTEDTNNPLYMRDLYFDIKLLTIVYDSSEYTAIETASSADLSTLIFFGGSVAILGGGSIFWVLHSSRVKKAALSNEKMSLSMRVKAIQKDKDQLRELRDLTESLTSSEESTKKQEVKFNRRRK